ncbi:MAG: DUF2029 domain-containing protein [Burkholderiales bacterium]|nr:DUF2029 domain-containing protein [Burkholderiales bacterium]
MAALLVALSITCGIAALTVLARLVAGDGLKPALRAASALEARKLPGPSGLDSWGAMLSAAHRQRGGGSVYAAAMALDNCKYQYPPAALLLMEVVPHPEGAHLCTRDAEAGAEVGAEPARPAWPAKRWIDLASQASLLATLALSLVLLRQALAACAPAQQATHRPEGGRSSIGGAGVAGLLAALGLSFFPLTWGHALGQIQVQLNLAMTAALCAMLAGRATLAGALLGLCCLFKPTYALFAAWALLRREWRLAAALLGVAAVGHGLALARYGLAVHLEYLEFLRGLGRVGESYWANQSLTGLLHRWLDPASALRWADAAFGSSARVQLAPPAFDWAAAGFPDEHAGVYVATVAFSLLLLGTAFWPVRGPTPGRGPMPALIPGHAPSALLARTLDLGVAMAAITMASPIVWLHHYGSFFALFVLALAVALQRPGGAANSRPGAAAVAPAEAVPAGRTAPTSRTTLVALALAYAMAGSVVLRPEAIFADRLSGLLGSLGLVGALLLLWQLWRLRRACTGAP